MCQCSMIWSIKATVNEAQQTTKCRNANMAFLSCALVINTEPWGTAHVFSFVTACAFLQNLLSVTGEILFFVSLSIKGSCICIYITH